MHTKKKVPETLFPQTLVLVLSFFITEHINTERSIVGWPV